MNNNFDQQFYIYTIFIHYYIQYLYVHKALLLAITFIMLRTVFTRWKRINRIFGYALAVCLIIDCCVAESVVCFLKIMPVYTSQAIDCIDSFCYLRANFLFSYLILI